MPGFNIKFRFKEINVGRRLKQLAGRMANPRPVLLAIGEYMLRRTDERFTNQRDPWGRAWKKLSPVTWRTKKHSKILTESGNLRGRIVYRVAGSAVKIGTNVIYAAIHQMGGTIRKNVTVRRHWRVIHQAFGRPNPARRVLVGAHERQMNVTIPARPFLGVNREDRREFKFIVNDYVTDV